MKCTCTLALLFLLFLSCDNPAQFSPSSDSDKAKSGNIKGFVFFKDQAVFAAKVTLIGGRENQNAQTDDKGMFTFAKLDSGFYTIKVSHSGLTFAPYTLQVTGGDSFGITIQGQENQGLISDNKGLLWDYGLRTATSWENAKNICNALRGRLPSISELYRNNSLNGTNDLITDNEDIALWTLIPWDKTTYATVKLKDGTIANANGTSLVNFRCVYPLTDESHFQSFVTKSPDSTVFAFTDGPNKVIVDSYDRPPLPFVVAVREAEFMHAKLPDFYRLGAAISKGLPNGTSKPLFSSDFVYSSGSVLKVATLSWEQNGGFKNGISNAKEYGADLITKAMPFRLIGEVPSDKLPHFAEIESTKTLTAAQIDSFSVGEHLPFLHEIYQGLYRGLDGGTGVDKLWSSDYVQSKILSYKWSGNDKFLVPIFNTNLFAGTYKTSDSNRYRTVRYEIDGDYQGPGISKDKMQSFVITRPDGSVLRIWADLFDRPAKDLAQALKEAIALGARIPSRRDLAELIGAGLKNGSNSFLYTSDATSETSVAALKWTGQVDASSFDESSTNTSGEIVVDLNIHPYRLIWSNEIR